MTTTWNEIVNFGMGTIKTALGGTAGDTSIVLQTGHGASFGSTFTVGMYLALITPNSTVGYEIVTCTGRTSDTLTVSRGQLSTSIVPHAVGTLVRVPMPKEILEAMRTAINALEGGIGAMIETPSATQSIVAGTGITEAMIAYHTLMVEGSGGAVNISANPQIFAGTNGQHIKIVGTSDTNTLQINNGNGVVLRYPGLACILGLNDALWLEYRTGQGWCEENRIDC